METKDFILASGSPQRIALLRQIGFEPKKIQPADIDEGVNKHEAASSYVKRMALEKALHVAELNPEENILACDTIVVVGATIIQKAPNDERQTQVMKMLSGKTHRVMSAVCVIDKKGHKSIKLSTTKVTMKHLTEAEIKDYVACHEWVGCCGYMSEGILEAFIKKIIGSNSGIIGLPLYETRNMLLGAGVK